MKTTARTSGANSDPSKSKDEAVAPKTWCRRSGELQAPGGRSGDRQGGSPKTTPGGLSKYEKVGTIHGWAGKKDTKLQVLQTELSN